jgi:non-specific protein-tyrosine kinase
MKIRKALERARNERKESLLNTQIKRESLKAKKESHRKMNRSHYKNEKAFNSSGDTKMKGEEWIPPKYTESKIIQLNLHKLKKNRCVAMFPNKPETEAYKVLRIQMLQRTREKELNTVMITSALPGEGKTLTSINMALSLAKEFNQTVLLVDCDLKHQNVHKYLGFSSDTGLIDYLKNGHMLKELFIWPGVDKFTLISGGKTVNDSSEYLGSPKMRELVNELKTRYDDRYVVFDAPPVLAGADAITLAPLVDSILMVVEAGRTSINDVKKALELIPQEKFLGFVLNRHKSKLSRYVYEYNPQ